MLKDFQESLCQNREPLSTLRAFLLFFPLVVKASHWCLSKGPFARIVFAGAAIHTNHLQGVIRDAWGVAKVPDYATQDKYPHPSHMG